MKLKNKTYIMITNHTIKSKLGFLTGSCAVVVKSCGLALNVELVAVSHATIRHSVL